MAGRDYIGLAAMSLLLAVIPLAVTNEYYLGTLVFAAFNAITCTGLCLLMGYAGQISIGHAAFTGIGAYATGILTVNAGWPLAPAMGTGLVAAAVVAALVGAPSLRLKGHYLAMATLGFCAILHIVAVAATDFTGGPEGINNIPRVSLFGLSLDSEIRFYYFSWGVFALGMLFAINLIHSRVGRGLKSLHGSEDAAESLGVNTSAYKVRVFVLSAVYAAMAGGLYASYMNYIEPGPFGVEHSVLLVTMVAVGGMHSIWGAAVGSVLLTLLPEFLSMISDEAEFLGIAYDPDYDMLIYGGILLSIMLFLPEGLFHGIRDLAVRVAGLVRRTGDAEGPR